MFKKIVAYILVFATVISFVVVPSFAAVIGHESIITDSSSLTAWDNWLDRNIIVKDFGLIDCKAACWTVIDRCFSSSGCGSVSSYDALLSASNLWNKRISSPSNWGSLAVYCVIQGFDSSVPTAQVAFDDSLGVYRLREYWSGLWLVNSSGHFPYYRPDTVDDTTGTENIRTGQWLEMSQITTKTDLWHVASNYELNEYKDQWSDVFSNIRLQETDNYFWLTVTVGARPLVLCDKDGYPYYLPKDKETAVTTPQNYYQDITNQYTDNSTNVNVQDGGSAVVGSPIDVNNGIINVGGQVQYIDQLIYDASTQTYYVDAHDEYVYDIELNQYVTNNYSYEIQYHIDHTSITYIGQTEEYDERYEMYFQLPDGRSSADLTAEDLEQLSTVFADVVQYARSADDLSLRGLYHFDGNTEDSSYWSYCTAFDWASGASLTYMDEGTFNGSLYLDETEHDFTITLPSATDLSSDFTIQFRYYQSHTTAPVADSYIQLGSDVVFQFTGSQYLLGSGDALCNTSIGCWNEICIMKCFGTIYYYINGVLVNSVSDNRAHDGVIEFFFGETQQTYKKLDELRITKRAVYTPGEDYIPSSVPFDTNLSLVLPDGDIPMADEVMVFTPSANNMLANYGLADWTTSDVQGSVSGYKDAFDVHTLVFARGAFKKSELIYDSGYVGISQGEDGTIVDFGGNAATRTCSGDCNYYCVGPHNSLFLPFNYDSDNDIEQKRFFDIEKNKTYTLSVVLADGTSSSCTFSYGTSVNHISSRIESDISFKASYTYMGASNYWHSHGIYIYSETATSAEIIYMELVEGTEPEFTVSYETAMYSSGELKESPVLAVRTNRPISGYQIGGVRPSYPQRGLVYAMVENSRIISLQQYTGYAWEQVDGRIWTGERWVPYGSFDVFTLKDYHDIIGGSDPDYEYIYTETGFWAWLQRIMLQILEKLDAIILALGGDPDALPGGSSGNDEDLTFMKRIKKIFEDSLAKIVESLLELITKVLDLVLGVVYDLLDFFFGLITDVVTNGIGDFLTVFTDGSLLQFFQSQEPMLDSDGQPVLDENGNTVMVTVFGLPTGIAAVFAFISATIMLLPSELYFALLFGIGVAFLLAVLKLIRS